MAKDAKGAKPKRTILDVRGKHHVSQRALAHICENLKQHGMVKATSRRTMQRNRNAFADRTTPYGKLIQLTEGPQIEKRRLHQPTILAPNGNAMGVLRRLP